MRFYASLLSILVFCLTGCSRQDASDYNFAIRKVTIADAYQSLDVKLQQDIELSQQARDALEHGVSLTLSLELELNNDDNLIVRRRDITHYQLDYLPLSERYQLVVKETGELRTFSRLRHLLASLDDLDIRLPTGPLPSGGYELRTRIRLDKSRLPAPMQLPAWFSSQWQHDSEWSVWPFKINA